MDAILILAIISIQFALIYFGVKYLSELNNKLIEANIKLEEIIPKIQPNFEKCRKALNVTNNLMVKYLENQDKIKIVKYILLFYSLISAIYIFKKKKNILNAYSLYDVVIKMAKTILGF